MSHTPKNAVVWAEIPVTDMTAAVAFYNTVFGFDLQIDNSGPNPMAMLPTNPPMEGTAGHLYTGKPAAKGTGPTVHMAIPDTVEEARARCIGAGGDSEGPVIEMPFGRWAYATDPDGNSIGLFQMAG
ncbi:MAG: VOC family protein [Rhodobacteraceae bacterium]|nr:VOC family protein [Paracoccaceae bacterium]